MSLTAPEQPAEGQDPQGTPAAAAPPVASPPAAAAPAGPWVNDLNALFPDDEAARGQVDQFLREKVQPYTTKLEQQASQSQDATRLWNDLTNNPIDTYVALTNELYDPETAQELLGVIQQRLQAQQQGAPGQTPESPAAPVTDPRLEQVLSYVEEKRNNEYYEGQIAAIKADPQLADVDTNLLHPFVAAAGNFEDGIKLYRESAAQFQAKYGAPPAEPPPAAPNVMGSDTPAATAPPVIPPKESLDQAIESWVRESNSTRQAAPPVGTA